ncbi:DUF5703 domain-containing protein [Spirosoma validum]|uniref:DUF5703 domain-containing protein n=1 Tax=Spirosoma validum TaxID=2771355 RepID=A0A927B5U8_9BACT|nr:DUF5703 domain-containing protein [Spirosoma validum]MBD2755742.1 hypothetical protein [Spirosoma validum]
MLACPGFTLFSSLKRLFSWILYIIILIFSRIDNGLAQQNTIDQYNVVWNNQSKNSSESMPCGGGDVGLNVWVENGDLLFYVAKSGTFDHNNTVLKLGRVRLKLSPNPFAEGATFQQELVLNKGQVEIKGATSGLSANVTIWVDVFRPVVHVDVSSNKPIRAEAAFESWRYVDHVTKGKENNANSYKFAPQGEVRTLKDSIRFAGDDVIFYHRNGTERSAFDVTVQQQGLDSIKNQLFNPIANRTFGGSLSGRGFKPAGTYRGKYLDTEFQGWKLVSASAFRTHALVLTLHTDQSERIDDWKQELENLRKEAVTQAKTAQMKTQAWWNEFWTKSFIYITSPVSSPEWQVARNYQLFRYMLGCNALGKYPTKFNGGLFTYDPSLTDSTMRFTPDFRNWGGGIHTAQNQRLVYWPMLKSGDWQLMKPQFDFYRNILKNAELRTAFYWKHKGASFTEQIENFGLPNSAEYTWKRPADYDKGMEYNAWLEYEWDTVLEFCLMMLETERYVGQNISEYVPLIESCLTFFDEHYQYLARRRGSKSLDGDKKLILYPGSAAETYKMAYNSSSTVSALRTVLTRLLELPDTYLTAGKREAWKAMLERIPPINYRSFDGHPTIAPAKLWERINNTESPQLYPVFPWGIYGIGKPGLDTAVNTYRYDKDVLRFRSHVGWKQDNIFAARLGLTDEAARLTLLKLGNSPRRFPAFWGPGFDWTPDHNWGGSGMIGIQEMLMQVDGKKIFLFPAWPKTWDVHVKLHAPYNTTVEAVLKNGKLESLNIIPESRRVDVENLLR